MFATRNPALDLPQMWRWDKSFKCLTERRDLPDGAPPVHFAVKMLVAALRQLPNSPSAHLPTHARLREQSISDGDITVLAPDLDNFDCLVTEDASVYNNGVRLPCTLKQFFLLTEGRPGRRGIHNITTWFAEWDQPSDTCTTADVWLHWAGLSNFHPARIMAFRRWWWWRRFRICSTRGLEVI